MLIVGLIGLIMLVIMIGLGYWSYVLGKRDATKLVGSIIPVGYFAVRAILATTLQGTTRELITSLVGSVIFALIYYGLFALGKQRQRKKIR